MITAGQRRPARPRAAGTATKMAVGARPGAELAKVKNVPLIAMAHEIPYVATATVADLHDLEAKVERAMSLHGARYLHILVPCPLGWGSASHDTIRLARLARETGIFPVFEAEHGEVTRVTRIRRRLRSGVALPDARQPVPRDHGTRLLSQLRRRLQPRPHRHRRRHQLGRALPRRRGDQARLALRSAREGIRQPRADRRRRAFRDV